MKCNPILFLSLIFALQNCSQPILKPETPSDTIRRHIRHLPADNEHTQNLREILLIIQLAQNQPNQLQLPIDTITNLDRHIQTLKVLTGHVVRTMPDNKPPTLDPELRNLLSTMFQLDQIQHQ